MNRNDFPKCFLQYKYLDKNLMGEQSVQCVALYLSVDSLGAKPVKYQKRQIHCAVHVELVWNWYSLMCITKLFKHIQFNLMQMPSLMYTISRNSMWTNLISFLFTFWLFSSYTKFKSLSTETKCYPYLVGLGCYWA